jgi:zinc transporter ZupT
MVTAIATGLGAVPFLFIRSLSKWWLGISNAIAAGLMLGASHNLIAEGAKIGPSRVLAGMMLGVAAITLANWILDRGKSVHFSDLGQADARKALLILGIMTAHSFAEGISVGVAFAGTNELGWFITTAIAIHNIPEGLAISLVLIPRGTSVLSAGLWSIFTSLPQPLMAVPAFLFVTAFEPMLPVGLGLAAGAMLWMIFADLVPEALETTPARAVGIAVVIAMMALWWFQHLALGHW